MKPETPQQIGPYRVTDELGEGGMGAVYRAVHQDTGNVVALKTVRVPKETLLNNLRREIHTLSRLHHEGIVRIVEQGIEGERPWYAMEYVEGVTLRQYILGTQTPPQPSSVSSRKARESFSSRATRNFGGELGEPAALLTSAIARLIGEDPGLDLNIEDEDELSLIVDKLDAFAAEKASRFTPAPTPSPANDSSSGGSSRWWTQSLEDKPLPKLPVGDASDGDKRDEAEDASGEAVPSSTKEEDAFAPDADEEGAKTILDLSPFFGLSLPGGGPSSPAAETSDPAANPPVVSSNAAKVAKDTSESEALSEEKKSDSGAVADGDTMLGLSPFVAEKLPTSEISDADLPAAEGRPPLQDKELRKSLQVLLKLCEPLAYLHGEGIVHCDLKPENVLVRGDGSPVLIDFGLLAVFAGWFNREVADFTRAGLGTLPYMAPEQISGRLIDARADLYALGCIIYEMLVGEPPFVGSWTEMIGGHLYSEPIPPKMKREGIPDVLNELVLQMLAKEPRDRIGHVDAVRSVVYQLSQEGEGTQMALPSLKSGAASRVYLFRPEMAGRKAELAELQKSVRVVRQGGSGLVMIGGESGVGKTRLMLELAQYARTMSLNVMTGECLDHTASPLEAFQPFFLSVADRLRVSDASVRDALINEESRWLLPYAPVLQEFAPSDLQIPQELPPSQLRMRVFRALGKMLVTFAQEKPLLLILDDLHWADELTLGALVHLVRMKSLHGILIVGSFRSEEAQVALHLLTANENVLHLELERLDEAAVEAIILDMLALPDISRGLVSYLTYQSEGNPFFVAEYLRAAVEEGLLWRDEKGRWQVSDVYETAAQQGDFSRLPLPSSLHSLVSSRLRDVSDRAATVLAVAAVIGREIPLHLLRQAMNMDMEQLWAILDELRRRQILEYRFDGMLCFAHDKIREVVYGGLAPQEFVVLHRRAAQAYEVVFRQERALYSGIIGFHWEHAEEPERAGQYYKHGGFRAQSQQADHESIELYRAFLALPLTPSQEHIEVLHALGAVYDRLGMRDEARESCEQALAFARQLSLLVYEAKSLFVLGGMSWAAGALEAGKQWYEQALDVQRTLGDTVSQGITLCNIARFYYAKGELNEAWKAYEEAIGFLRGTTHARTLGRALTNMGSIRFEQGEWKEARHLFREALALHRDGGHVLHQGLVTHHLGNIHRYLEEYASAEEMYEEALALFQQVGNVTSIGVAYGSLAQIDRDRGSFEQAEKRFQRAIGIHREQGNRVFEGTLLIEYIRLKRWMGEPHHALETGLARCEELLRNANNQLYLAELWCELGHVGLVGGVLQEDLMQKLEEANEQLGLADDYSSPLGHRILRLRKAYRAHEEKRPLRFGEDATQLPRFLLEQSTSD